MDLREGDVLVYVAGPPFLSFERPGDLIQLGPPASTISGPGFQVVGAIFHGAQVSGDVRVSSAGVERFWRLHWRFEDDIERMRRVIRATRRGSVRARG